MIKKISKIICFKILLVLSFVVVVSCKQKKHVQKTVTETVISDTLNGRCKLDFKSSKTLSNNIKENEFNFIWVNAKANVETLIDGKEESFDIRVKIKKDSAMLVSIQYLLGLEVAKILITKDSVKLVNYIQKNYFIGDFNYLNDLLNTELDFNVLQAVLFGNSAEFYEDDDLKLKPIIDRENCHYLLSTERKRKLKKLQTTGTELKKALQILTLSPENYKILKNEFVDPGTSRTFIAKYKNFTQKDSVYAPFNVDIDIYAEKKANIKIEYVRIEKNTPQKISINIPNKYDRLQIQKK